MFYLVAVVFIISTLIKLGYISGNNFAFTPDQGRDLIDIRQMVVTHMPRLVGPTTSVNGVLLGPFYYYFIAIPFILFRGSPAAIVIWQIAWFQISALIMWYVLRKKNLVMANIAAILILLSPVGFYTGRYFWNANVMPIFTVIFFACLLDTLWYRQNFRLVLLGLVAGISLQIEAAFGLLFFPLALLILLYKKFPPKDLLKLSLAFGLTLLPQVVFEFRHGFLMTKTLIAGLTGTSADLGEKLIWSLRLVERRNIFLIAMKQSDHLAFEWLGPILLLAALLGVYFVIRHQFSKPENDLSLISISFLILAAIFYLIFPQHLKNWYVFGLPIPIIIFLSGVLSNFYDTGRLGIALTTLFIVFSLYYTLLAHTQYLFQYALVPSSDPSNMATEMRAVDLVYREAGGQAFEVYNYLPSIYDYTYQYLFWWYGTQKYGYQPSEIAYLPHQPEYIVNNSLFWTQKKATNHSSPTFLIIQGDGDHQERLYAWRGNFTQLCEISTTAISSGLSVSKLAVCPKIK